MAQPLQRFLGGGESLERLHEHAMRLRRLQSILRDALPDALADSCGVGNLKGDQLVLLARNGAVAAKLRQLTPTLMQSLAERGQIVGRIQVRVQLAEESPPPPQREVRTISEGSLRDLTRFAEALPADAPLRLSLQRLIDRSKRS